MKPYKTTETTIPEEIKERKKGQIKNIYERYGYSATEEGMDNMLGVHSQNKGWIYERMVSHPFYNGDLKIVFPARLIREPNWKKVRDYLSWVDKQLLKKLEEKEIKLWGCSISEFDLNQVKVENRVSDLEYFSMRYRRFLPANFECVLKEEKLLLERMKKARRELGGVRTLMGGCTVKDEEYDKYVLWNNIFRILLGERENIWLIPDSEEFLAPLNNRLKELGVSFEAHAGQKTTKFLQKLCKKTGLDKIVELKEETWTEANGEVRHRTKDYGYNNWQAIIGDAINPIYYEQECVMSIDPIDYILSSNGASWSSCHDLSREFFNGEYMSGTISYMLDPSTIVVYQRPSETWLKENGESNLPIEEQSKLRRCMFYLGEDKFVQSRTYPDGRDGGEKTISDQLREQVQKILSEMFDIPNMWKLKRGSYEADDIIETDPDSTHYRDYHYYDDVCVSYLRNGDTINNVPIEVGHAPICACCGREFGTTSDMNCDDCNEVEYCTTCGDAIYSDPIYVDGDVFCCSSCAEEAGYRYCTDIDEWVYYTDCYYDEWAEDYFYDTSEMVEFNGGFSTLCFRNETNAERYGLGYSEYDDEWTSDDEIYISEPMRQSFIWTDESIETEDGNYFPSAVEAEEYGYHQNEDGEWTNEEAIEDDVA